MQEAIIVSSYATCNEAFAQADKSAVLWLKNPPHSIHYLGAFYLWHLVKQVAAYYPLVNYQMICDCDNDAMAVIQALQTGFTMVCYQGPPDVTCKLNDIASKYHATISTTIDHTICKYVL